MNILMVSPVPFLPCDAGDRARIYNTILALRAAGYSVHFLHVARAPGDREGMEGVLGAQHFRSVHYARPTRQETRLQRARRHLVQLFDPDARHLWGLDDWYIPEIGVAALDWHAAREFRAVIVEYVFLSKVLESFPDTVYKVLDTLDRFTMRHRLYTKRGMPPAFFSTSAAEEARGLSRADLILAIEEEESLAFRRVARKPVVTLGHLVRLQRCLRERDASAGPKLLIVGSDNDLNIHGLRAFLADDWPAILKRIPQAQLLVAGQLAHSAPSSPSILSLGYVPDIADAYRSADIVINPVRAGTGMNVKSIEALGFGMPLVTTEQGARGLRNGAGVAFLQADGSQTMADAVEALWLNWELAKRLSEGASDYAGNYNRACLAVLSDAIAGWDEMDTRKQVGGPGAFVD